MLEHLVLLLIPAQNDASAADDADRANTRHNAEATVPKKLLKNNT